MKEYKVEIVKGNFWSGNVATKKLQPLLNESSQDGWSLDKITATERHSFFLGTRTLLIVTFSK